MPFKKVLVLITAVLMIPTFAAAKQKYIFTGGKAGGTAIYYASAISELAKKNNLTFLVNSSGGAVEQIRLVNSGKSDFSLAYSGQVFAASKGKLKNDPKKYTDVRSMAFFYGAPAQLIVRKNSGIHSAKDLAGKKIGVGNAGSGAAANAQLFFTELGIWKDIHHNFIGYRQASDAFKNGQLDAFWVFVSYPNASVTEAAMQNEIALVDLYKDGESIDLFKKYPYFSKVIIPAGTYKGVDTDVASFQDKTLWIVNKNVPDEVVYKILDLTFSKEGLAHMANAHKSARAMSLKTGGAGMATKMHPGAAKFWKDKGVL
ncbi:TAXI family TRAP transporter solute-binding subunit [Desulfospira joergensenii]|uniref:TAXI family TRAP transporter solute-binding subunit n=1 Tax=Desulfospira joergensenii TaxID=53329 RepID=UPI0003B5AAE8|nr:TAXI family TRAP transporter solute-binding subunit [Desulfospira joergensenii]